MRPVYAVGDTIVSSLGTSTRENFRRVLNGDSAVRPVNGLSAGNEPVLAGVMDIETDNAAFTRFESLCFRAIDGILGSVALDPSRTLLVLSTTKGNIDLIESGNATHERLHIPETAEFIARKTGFPKNVVVSSACASGVLAVVTARRFIASGFYDTALVVGADVLSRFIVSGFQSLLALSSEPCRPFDVHRKGINLGEGAGAILLSAKPDDFPTHVPVLVAGIGSSNDANHISGPSRTGEELAQAVQHAMKSADRQVSEIDFISAHGTATLYNDEMESKAFDLCRMNDVPLHSLKGYYGHTLGAAGVIETIIGMECLRQNIVVPSLGYSSSGVSRPLNVAVSRIDKPLRTFLKTSSGFGGCNAALVLQKQ